MSATIRSVSFTLFATLAVGCSTDDSTSGQGGGGLTDTDGGRDAGVADRGAGSDADVVETLSWRTIPDLVLAVGVPVDVDLHNNLVDPSGAAVVTLDGILPNGLALSEGAIVGTPTAQTPSSSYVANADDGDSPIAVSEPFLIEVRQNSIDLTFERATPEQIGIYIPLSQPLATGATATVRYRPTDTPNWLSALPLFRIHPEWTTGGAPVPPVDAFAGSIFDLTPGSSYEIEVTMTSSGSAPQTVQTIFTTRPLPPESGAATVQATTSDNLQERFDALRPGDVLELAAGIYEVDGLQLEASGSQEQTITIRGADREGVILRSSGRVLQVLEASHVTIENLTLEGSGTDSGTDASSVGVSFWNGALQEFITLRRVNIEGVDMGVVASGTVRSILVYDSVLTGNNIWNADFVETNLTWNDDAVRLPGEGNCAFNNTLHGFGDVFAVQEGVFSAAVYFYRNRISMTGDDGFEGDYGTRNLAFYDNHITNSGTLMSLDPLWGGPLYCFRNIAINTVRGPFKWNSQQSGFLVANNTIVRTEGTTGWGWVQFNNGELRNLSVSNNILIYRGAGTLMALESGGMDPIDFNHNGWYPDGPFWWSNSGGAYSTLAEALAGLPDSTPVFGGTTRRHEGGVILEAEPFVDAIPLGPNHLTEITTFFVPTLGTSVARGSGIAVPNITDGFVGAAPDLGALIEGRPMPIWGAR